MLTLTCLRAGTTQHSPAFRKLQRSPVIGIWHNLEHSRPESFGSGIWPGLALELALAAIVSWLGFKC